MLVPAETCANDEGPGADPNAIAPTPEPASRGRPERAEGSAGEASAIKDASVTITFLRTGPASTSSGAKAVSPKRRPLPACLCQQSPNGHLVRPASAF
jgi:hypothetical protein